MTHALSVDVANPLGVKSGMVDVHPSQWKGRRSPVVEAPVHTWVVPLASMAAPVSSWSIGAASVASVRSVQSAATVVPPTRTYGTVECTNVVDGESTPSPTHAFHVLSPN